ncbi:MAG: chemotaxis protein CheX [Magnetococcales bacterium]|nr:chemotaxis protein CheX [Magnetococcales bacterium]
MDLSQNGDDKRETVFAALQVAVVDVLSRMAMTEALFVHREKMNRFYLDMEAGAMIRLTGDWEGMIGISGSLELVRSIVSRIVGLPAEQLNTADLMDGIAELANMVGGGTKSNAGMANVKVHPPMAVIGKEVMAEWKTDRSTEKFIFEVEESTLLVLANL